MNHLEQALAIFGANNVNEKVSERKERIIRVAVKPPVNGLLNKAHKHTKFVSETMCQWIINNAENYARENSGWTKTRHKNYPTTDLPVRIIPNLAVPLFNFVTINILPLISTHYILNLYFLNIADLFIVKYETEAQDHLDRHRDGSLISFNILLNDDFEGGGTLIEHTGDFGINKVLHTSKKGDLLIHPGKLFHEGQKITSGTRYILVGFIDYCSDKNELARRYHQLNQQCPGIEHQRN